MEVLPIDQTAHRNRRKATLDLAGTMEANTSKETASTAIPSLI